MKKLLTILLCSLIAYPLWADQNSPIPFGVYVPENPGFTAVSGLTGIEWDGVYMNFPVPMKISDISMYVFTAAGNIQFVIRNANGATTGPTGLQSPGTIATGCSPTSSQAVSGTGVQVFTSGCGTNVLPAGAYYIGFQVDSGSFQTLFPFRGFHGVEYFYTTPNTYGTWNSTFVVSGSQTTFGLPAIWIDAIPQSISNPGTADCLGGWPQPALNNGVAQAGNVAWIIGWQKSIPQCTGVVKSICTSIPSYGGSSGNWNGGVWDATGAPTGSDGDLGPNILKVQGTPAPYYGIGVQCVTPTTTFTAQSGTTYWVGAVPDTNDTGNVGCFPPGCTSPILGADYYMYQTLSPTTLTLANVSGTPSDNTSDWISNFFIVEPSPTTGRLRASVVNSQ